MGISGFYGIILLKKNHGIGLRDRRPGAQHRSVGAVHGLLNLDQHGSSPCRSAAQSRRTKGYGFFSSRPLIQDSTARVRIPPPIRLDQNRGPGGTWPSTGRAPSSGYGALNLKVTTPT
jgi:hypothetical protein